MWEKVKGVGFLGIVLGALLLVSLLVAAFIDGGVWLGTKVYPWLNAISAIAFGITILVLLPLSFFRRTRRVSAVSLLVSSHLMGLTLWFWGLLLTYYLWGTWAVFVGLFLLGVGVVPIAILATLFKGMWSQFGQLILLTAFVFGVRAYNIHVAQKAEQESYDE